MHSNRPPRSIYWKAWQYKQWIRREREKRFRQYWLHPNTVRFLSFERNENDCFTVGTLKQIAGEFVKEKLYKAALFDYWYCNDSKGQSNALTKKYYDDVMQLRSESLDDIVERVLYSSQDLRIVLMS